MTTDMILEITATLDVLCRYAKSQSFIQESPSKERYKAALKLKDSINVLLTELETEEVLSLKGNIQVMGKKFAD